MIYIAICDDDKESLRELSIYVKKYINENKEIAEITEYDQSRMLLYDVQEGKHFDLILTDIEMPHYDGMSLVKHIKKYLPEVLIVFITSHVKYAMDAYELSIFRYIHKNMLSERLTYALRDSFSMINMQSDKYYVIATPSRVEKIPYKKIVYIQRDGKNSVIVLLNGKISKVRKSLSQLYSEFESEDFVYIDRGTIVNLAHIMAIRNTMIELKNGICLPASHAKLEETKDKLFTFWGENI